jgi:hypothetical protein
MTILHVAVVMGSLLLVGVKERFCIPILYSPLLPTACSSRMKSGENEGNAHTGQEAMVSFPLSCK